jgi:HEAT repeat protein
MNWKSLNENYNALIKQLFHGKEWEDRAEAARQLGFLQDGRAVNLLCRALKSEKDSSVSLRIIEALGRIGDGRATLRILEQLDNELEKEHLDKRKIIFIIESLMRIKDKRALPRLSLFLDSKFEEIRDLAEKAFDSIEPRWREILEGEKREKSIKEIFEARL